MDIDQQLTECVGVIQQLQGELNSLEGNGVGIAGGIFGETKETRIGYSLFFFFFFPSKMFNLKKCCAKNMCLGFVRNASHKIFECLRVWTMNRRV